MRVISSIPVRFNPPRASIHRVPNRSENLSSSKARACKVFAAGGDKTLVKLGAVSFV